MSALPLHLFFFLNDTATPEFYPLPLHAALPISRRARGPCHEHQACRSFGAATPHPAAGRSAADRKSTRLNSSHTVISYAVFCLKKKKKKVVGEKMTATQNELTVQCRRSAMGS